MTPDSLILATDTINQLNIVGSSKAKFGSVFNLINHTNTAMGRRLLKERLIHPLKNKETIEQRYEMVEWGCSNFISVMKNILKIFQI